MRKNAAAVAGQFPSVRSKRTPHPLVDLQEVLYLSAGRNLHVFRTKCGRMAGELWRSTDSGPGVQDIYTHFFRAAGTGGLPHLTLKFRYSVCPGDGTFYSPAPYGRASDGNSTGLAKPRPIGRSSEMCELAEFNSCRAGHDSAVSPLRLQPHQSGKGKGKRVLWVGLACDKDCEWLQSSCGSVSCANLLEKVKATPLPRWRYHPWLHCTTSVVDSSSNR